MSNIVNPNGQTVTSETPTPNAAPRQSVSPAEMQQIMGALAQYRKFSTATIITPREEAEKAGLLNFLNGSLLNHAEELIGSWVVCQNEYSPLITGFTGLLRRALARIDAANQQPVPTEVADKPAA